MKPRAKAAPDMLRIFANQAPLLEAARADDSDDAGPSALICSVSHDVNLAKRDLTKMEAGG
jgi:hypothetical protein